MADVRAALRAGAEALVDVSETPRLDAELLMAHALDCARETMLLSRMAEPAPPGFDALVLRRAAHEPVAYIVGRRAFWTIELEVGPGVLVPRPDSETLIEAAVAHFGAAGPRRVLDLGTGPGTLLLAALSEWPDATGIGIDASPDAVGYAHRNAERTGVGGRAVFRTGDWTAGVAERFDLILCNPPYIGDGEPLPRDVRGWEPAGALFAGADGLEDYRRIVPALPGILARGGMAAIEVGHTQGGVVAAMVGHAGLSARLCPDLAGRMRCVVAT